MDPRTQGDAVARIDQRKAELGELAELLGHFRRSLESHGFAANERSYPAKPGGPIRWLSAAACSGERPSISGWSAARAKVGVKNAPAHWANA